MLCNKGILKQDWVETEYMAGLYGQCAPEDVIEDRWHLFVLKVQRLMGKLQHSANQWCNFITQ